MSGFFVPFLVMLATGLLSLIAFVYTVYHIGRVLKSIELGRPARGGEAAGYAFLAYLLIVGCWIFQPKLNRLRETGSMEKPEDPAQVW